MARIQSFARDLKLATESISPENIAAELAKFARDSLAEGIREGWASPRYEKYVNGRFGAEEETVTPPGPIVYDFHWWNEIIEFSMTSLAARSPVKTGRYRESFAVMINGAYTTDLNAIPIDAEVIVVNKQPYARKIEVGFMTVSVPPAVVEDTMTKVRQRFGNMIEVRKTMVTIPNPYILKGAFRKGIRPQSRTKLRKDTQAGAAMTYPALKMMMRA